MRCGLLAGQRHPASQPPGLVAEGVHILHGKLQVAATRRLQRGAHIPADGFFILYAGADSMIRITIKVMTQVKKDQEIFYIGTSGWTYDDWEGRFYPAGLARSHWFEYYSNQFSTVEVNATFYRTFKDDTYLGWKSKAPKDFRYVLKAPRTITHQKNLIDVEDDIKNFVRSALLLADLLGMILLQVAPSTPYDLKRLKQALLAFPDPSIVAVEFRNPDWLSTQTETLLRDLGASFCNADSPTQKLTRVLTSKRAYIRMHGRRKWYSDFYGDDELLEIANIARDLARRGASEVYVFFNNDYFANACVNAKSLLKLLAI